MCPLSGLASRNGQALQFDGIDDVLVSAFRADVTQLAGDFTVAAWVKPRSFPTAPGALILGNGNSTTQDGYNFGTDGSEIMLELSGVGKHVTTMAALEANVWTHIAANIKPDNSVDFYRNGVLLETSASIGPMIPDVNEDNLFIGGEDFTFRVQRFDGLLDDLFVMHGSPAAADWQAIMGLAPTFHLTFDQQTFDDFGFLNDASGMGSSSQFISQVTTRTLTTGIVGSHALNLAQSNGVQIVGAEGTIPHQLPFTLSFWVRDFNSFFMFFGNQFYTKPSGSNMLNITVAEGSCDVPLGDTDGWHHLTFSADGTTPFKVYWDGMLASAGANCPVVATLGSVFDLYFQSEGVQPMGIDDLRVYQRALSELEVGALAGTAWQSAEAPQLSYTTMVDGGLHTVLSGTPAAVASTEAS